MFGLISKKKLRNYIEEIKRGNRARNLGQKYDFLTSEEQRKKNIYAQGYEDGTDNFYNALLYRFSLKK